MCEMNTRFCLNCGEPYESDAKLSLPFCCKECREFHNMSAEEREQLVGDGE